MLRVTVMAVFLPGRCVDRRRHLPGPSLRELSNRGVSRTCQLPVPSPPCAGVRAGDPWISACGKADDLSGDVTNDAEPSQC